MYRLCWPILKYLRVWILNHICISYPKKLQISCNYSSSIKLLKYGWSKVTDLISILLNLSCQYIVLIFKIVCQQVMIRVLWNPCNDLLVINVFVSLAMICWSLLNLCFTLSLTEFVFTLSLAWDQPYLFSFLAIFSLNGERKRCSYCPSPSSQYLISY